MPRSDPILRWDVAIIQMLVVIVLLGTITGVALQLFGQNRDDILRATFISNVKSYTGTARLYHYKMARPLRDAPSGVVPPGFEEFIDVNNWIGGTPIGGAWDVIEGEYGVESALGVHFNGMGETRDDLFMAQVDAALDDGDLAKGRFQKLDEGRYYFILVE